MNTKILTKYKKVSRLGSYSGISGFLKNNPSLKNSNTTKVILNDPTYALHKPVIKKFNRIKTIVNSIDECWQIDLVDVSNLKSKKFSQFYNFFFVCIDVFSKYSFVEPIKKKQIELLKIFLNQEENQRISIQTEEMNF